MTINGVNNRKRSKFNLSHTVKLSCDMGNLIPVLCEDVVPGDTFKIKTDALVRFAPMLAPLMHEVDVFVHYFFVPDRLTHENFEDFITGGERGDDVTVSPYITADVTTGFTLGSLPDYFGMPLNVPNIQVDAKPFRAYSFILNEFYRQQDLQDKLEYSVADGEDTTTGTRVYNRNWNPDYFTSALPFQQKGPAVALPLSGNPPVSGLGFGDYFSGESIKNVRETGEVDIQYSASQANWRLNPSGSSVGTAIEFEVGSGTGATAYPNIRVDLSEATSATVNDLRKAFQLQRHLERNMRCGARLTEFIQANYGIHNKDYRLQRPEFLGGGRSPVIFSEVLQTSSTDDTTAQGNMSGHGFSSFKKGGFVKSFTEHGWVIGLMSVMPKSAYNSYGIDRRFSKKTRFDYRLPDFVHLGEQAILNKEIYAQGTAVDDEVFGYCPQYQWDRKRLSRTCGEFRTDLNFWHLTREFDELPLLNSSFINCQPRNNIFAETAGTQKLRCYVYHKFTAIRILPKFGTPGYIDH